MFPELAVLVINVPHLQRDDVPDPQARIDPEFKNQSVFGVNSVQIKIKLFDF